jgi:hypothetical protein
LRSRAISQLSRTVFGRRSEWLETMLPTNL